MRVSSSFKAERALVIGLARSGVAAVELLLDLGVPVVASDLRPASELSLDAAAWESRGVRLALGEQDEGLLAGVDLVVVSPGVRLDVPIIKAARAAGVAVIGELELAYRVFEGTWIAVTGTNGKTTTTALTGHLATSAGLAAAVGGNIGDAISAEIAGLPRDGIVVAEVSSFQLDATELFRPHVSVLLNVTPDHLDRYGTMESYAASKRRVFANQTADDFAVLNVDDERVRASASQIAASVIPVSAVGEPENGVFVRDGAIVSRVGGGDREVARIADMKLLGPHNVQNALAAVGAAMAVGVGSEAAGRALATFEPLEHRMEPVARVGGALYVNDSKATNVDSVRYALESYDVPIVLIAGGRDKGADFGALVAAAAAHVRHAVVLGEAAPAIERALSGSVPTERAATLRDAVRAAAAAAESGDVVLLSPACASFDMFADFEERGRRFKAEVLALAGHAGEGE